MTWQQELVGLVLVTGVVTMLGTVAVEGLIRRIVRRRRLRHLERSIKRRLEVRTGIYAVLPSRRSSGGRA